MKRLVAALLAVLLLAGCSGAPGDGDAAQTTNPGTTESTVPVASSASYLIQDSGENLISIQIPHTDTMSEVETAFIQDFVRRKLETVTGAVPELTPSDQPVVGQGREYAQHRIDLESRVTQDTDAHVSIVFEGFYNLKSAAHPTNWLFSLNYAPGTLEAIPFAEKYAVNARLYQSFASAAESAIKEAAGGTWPEGWKPFGESICPEETFINGMCDEREFCYYLQEDGVVISYPVPHAVGDHLEAVIPYSQLEEAAAYYKITQNGSLYAYTIYNRAGEPVKTEENLSRCPRIRMVDGDLLRVTSQAGTGIETQSAFYYDVEQDRFSRVYPSVFDEFDGMVAHATVGKIVVRSIFDEQGVYGEISEFSRPFSEVAFPFVEAVFTDDGQHVSVTYIAGEGFEEVTEILEWTGDQ